MSVILLKLTNSVLSNFELVQTCDRFQEIVFDLDAKFWLGRLTTTTNSRSKKLFLLRSEEFQIGYQTTVNNVVCSIRITRIRVVTISLKLKRVQCVLENTENFNNSRIVLILCLENVFGMLQFKLIQLYYMEFCDIIYSTNDIVML